MPEKNLNKKLKEFLQGFIPSIIVIGVFSYFTYSVGGGLGGLGMFILYSIFILPLSILLFLILSIKRKFWVAVGIVIPGTYFIWAILFNIIIRSIIGNS